MEKFGGAKRDRTADLYNAIVALSQLSYSPVLDSYGFYTRTLAPYASSRLLAQPRQSAQEVFSKPNEADLNPSGQI